MKFSKTLDMIFQAAIGQKGENKSCVIYFRNFELLFKNMQEEADCERRFANLQNKLKHYRKTHGIVVVGSSFNSVDSMAG